MDLSRGAYPEQRPHNVTPEGDYPIHFTQYTLGGTRTHFTGCTVESHYRQPTSFMLALHQRKYCTVGHPSHLARLRRTGELT
jgi:hypothetical protein